MFNRDEFKGNWNQIKGELKKTWGKLTDDDLMQAQGDYDKLIGRIQERYGEEKADIERRVQDFYSRWNAGRSSPSAGKKTA